MDYTTGNQQQDEFKMILTVETKAYDGPKGLEQCVMTAGDAVDMLLLQQNRTLSSGVKLVGVEAVDYGYVEDTSKKRRSKVLHWIYVEVTVRKQFRSQ